MSFDKTAAGIAAGMALADMDNRSASDGGFRPEVTAALEALGTQKERYQKLMSQYDLLVKRFCQERGSLLGAARSRRYYRLAAHELSGADYEEVDAFVKQAMEKKDPEIESQMDRVEELRREDDLKAGVNIFRKKH